MQIGLVLALLTSLMVTPTGKEADLCVEVQFLEKAPGERPPLEPVGGRSIDCRMLKGTEIPKGYQVKGRVSVAAWPGQSFETETTVGDVTLSLAGTLEALANGRFHLEVEPSRARRNGPGMDTQRIHTTIEPRVGERFFMGDLVQRHVDGNGKEDVEILAITFTLKKREKPRE